MQLLEDNDEYSEAVTRNRRFEHFSTLHDHFMKNANILYLRLGVIAPNTTTVNEGNGKWKRKAETESGNGRQTN